MPKGPGIWCDNDNCTRDGGKRSIKQLGTRTIPNQGWIEVYGAANDGSQNKIYCCHACYKEGEKVLDSRMAPV